jgi:AcrR family transcriptional regulator
MAPKTGKPRSKSKPRRTQEERRADTQSRILTAALEVLVEKGHAHFTTIGVAAKAGVSRGAQENYYRTRTDLIAAATAHAMDEASTRTASSAERAKTSTDPLKAFLDDEKEFFFSNTYAAMVELALAGRDEPALEKIHRDAFVKFGRLRNKVWTEALTAGGYGEREVRDFVEMTVYLLRGMTMTDLILPQKSPADLLSRWRGMAPLVLKKK